MGEILPSGWRTGSRISHICSHILWESHGIGHVNRSQQRVFARNGHHADGRRHCYIATRAKGARTEYTREDTVRRQDAESGVRLRQPNRLYSCVNKQITKYVFIISLSANGILLLIVWLGICLFCFLQYRCLRRNRVSMRRHSWSQRDVFCPNTKDGTKLRCHLAQRSAAKRFWHEKLCVSGPKRIDRRLFHIDFVNICCCCCCCSSVCR